MRWFLTSSMYYSRSGCLRREDTTRSISQVELPLRFSLTHWPESTKLIQERGNCRNRFQLDYQKTSKISFNMFSCCWILLWFGNYSPHEPVAWTSSTLMFMVRLYMLFISHFSFDSAICDMGLVNTSWFNCFQLVLLWKL